MPRSSWYFAVWHLKRIQRRVLTKASTLKGAPLYSKNKKICREGHNFHNNSDTTCDDAQEEVPGQHVERGPRDLPGPPLEDPDTPGFSSLLQELPHTMKQCQRKLHGHTRYVQVTSTAVYFSRVEILIGNILFLMQPSELPNQDPREEI